MSALPPNNTDRYFFHYGNSFHNHTAVIRTETGASEATVISTLAAVLTEIGALFSLSDGIGADFQAAGTDFSVPSSNSGWAALTWGSGSATVESDSMVMNFQGRSSGGHKARFGLFGYKEATSGWKVTEAENAAIGDAVAIMNFASGTFLAIDGILPTWYGYVNIKPNDYWVRRARA